MDDTTPRDGLAEPRAWHASDDDQYDTVVRERSTPMHDDLSRRRQRFRRALTDRERAERWPCG